MTLAAKLQLKPGTSIALLDVPDGATVDLGDEIATRDTPDGADAVLVFLTRAADLDGAGVAALLAAVREDRLAWVAYPKAGKLGTDVNRDTLHRAFGERGAKTVRQVAIDDTWSALRLRPPT
jgi:hypothetical protein